MHRTCFVAALVAGSFGVVAPALAAVVDFGVDTSIRHYVFGVGSTATYYPGTSGIISEDPPGEGALKPESRSISGSFDAEFSRYWWKYEIGQPAHSTAITEQYWLLLTHSDMMGGGDWNGLALFGSFLMSEGANFFSFYGDSHPCSFPMGPDTSCTGDGIGTSPSASGALVAGNMILNGIIPLDVFGSYYSYHVVATPVPIPSAAWLFGPAVAGLAFLARREAQCRVCGAKRKMPEK